MRPLSESALKVADKNFTRKYIAIGRIVNSWRQIMGQDMAAKSQPMKLNYRKPKNRRSKPDVTLDIACSSSDATILHYQKDLILERINQIFGDRWVTDLKFVCVTANSDRKRKQNRNRPITMLEKNRVADMVSNVIDEEIQAKLKTLGLEILKEDTV